MSERSSVFPFAECSASIKLDLMLARLAAGVIAAVKDVAQMSVLHASIAVGALIVGTLMPMSTLAADEPGLSTTKPASGRYVETPAGFMVPYTVTIPGTDVKFEMQPAPGGRYRCGSPAGEAGRADDEGPQFEVEVAPFWIATHEVTWAEYKQYMRLHNIFKKINGAGLRPVTPELEKFVVTAPSNLYDPSFTFQLGDDLKLPAATMSQFAAKQYGKWLSGVTGQFYRLPSEVEWEYACRAGTTTAYSFGDDPKQLGEFAWFFGNSKEATHPVGQKKPNPWGLFDMHGNVAEWVLDEYADTAYAKYQGEPRKAESTIAWPTKLYPRVVRGGCWDDDAERLRSAARRGSHDDDWRAEDPNRPQSPWWFT
ncbi:MAG TPA: formylglycine-generating enzyme family protein, partial [Pirellulaceae bacterium]|nr:formylglycine-generating enzyme family protein [Pirellulaceae bacterium]